MDWNTLPQKDKEMLIRTYNLRTNEDLEKFIDAFNRRKKQAGDVL